MRYEFAKLHERLKTTMIYVTHDQVEAMTLADRIVVLNGRRHRTGRHADGALRAPGNLFVAEFIGSPKMNLLPAEIVSATAKGAVVKTAAGDTLKVSVDASTAKAGDKVTLGIRPEHLALGGPTGGITAQVTFAETLGHVTYAYATYGETALTVQLPGEVRPQAGKAIALAVPAEQAHLFDTGGIAFKRA
jgi:multiple sugar transport system ATP-binding protein